MNRFFNVLGALVAVAIAIGFVINLCDDFGHPELWTDWLHDPRLWGPLVILIVGSALWLAIHKEGKLQRRKRQVVRLDSMLIVIDELIKSGWTPEAEEANQFFHRVNAATSEAEEVMLTQQFLDKFGI